MTPLAILMIGIAATSLAAAGQHSPIAYCVPEWRPHLFPFSAPAICGYLIALAWIVVLRTGEAAAVGGVVRDGSPDQPPQEQLVRLGGEELLPLQHHLYRAGGVVALV